MLIKKYCRLHRIFYLQILLGFSIVNYSPFYTFAIEPKNITKNCSELFDGTYNLISSKILNPSISKELIFLNGISSSDNSGSIRANQKFTSPNNTLGFSIEFNWNNSVSNNSWWSIKQSLPPTPMSRLNDFDRVTFDIYPIKTNRTTHLRVFLQEDDGDRWIVTDLNLSNNLKIGTWNHFELKRNEMQPWLLGNGQLDWSEIKSLVFEPWSESKGKGQANFLIDGVTLLGSGKQTLDVFNTKDDGDWVDPSWNEPMQKLPSPGVVYLPGIGSERLSDTPQQFQKLLGRVGTSHVVGPKATKLVRSGIPVVGYTGLVQGYEKFLTRRGAWDVNAAGEGPGNIPLLLNPFTYFHTISLSHSGVASALQRRIDAMVKSGIGTFMAVDYTFPWNGGLFGYSNAMIAAYRDDLQAVDTGLQIVDRNQTKIIHFPDYFRLYHGFFPTAQDLGLQNWKAFNPPRPGENKLSNRAYWRLFMFLRSYEWLKLAGRTGRHMQCRGGHGLWVIPNPEDSLGSSDYAMLLRTAGVTNVFPEWFGGIATMSSAAYVSGPYLREQAKRGNSRLSALFETGAGGHAAPYWHWQVAFNGAYALTAATQADDFDNDFIDQAPFQEMSNPKTNPAEFNRFRDTVAKALGFQLAHQGKAKRSPSKILCVTERPPKDVSSFFFTIEDKRRPGLAGSLSRAHIAFDLRDSLELEQVLSRYDVIVYDVIAPRAGDIEHLQRWLKEKSGRVLVTHSFVPTRTAQGYWGSDSGTAFGSIKNALLGLGSLTRTNITKAIITSAVESWRPFAQIGKAFTLSDPLSHSEYGKPLIMTNVGPLVSQVVVGKSEVIYFNYTPGASNITKQLDERLALALMRHINKKSFVVANPEVSIQAFQVAGGQSVVVWDMPTEEDWASKNKMVTSPLRWRSSNINQIIKLPVNDKKIIYDFWDDKILNQLPEKGYLTLNLKGVSSKLFFVGADSKEFKDTISKARVVRKKMNDLQF
jgi:hypothetical protein